MAFENKKFLDRIGITHLWNKIENYFINSEELNIVIEAIDEAKADKDLIVTYAENQGFGVTHSSQEIYDATLNGITVKFQKDSELLNIMEATPDYATFYVFYVNMDGVLSQKIVVIQNKSVALDQEEIYDFITLDTLKNYYTKNEIEQKIADLVDSAPETLNTLGELAAAFNENSELIAVLNAAIGNKANTTEVLFKTEQALTSEELTQVRKNLKFIGKDVEGQTFTINGVEYTASPNAEIFGDYTSNIAVGQWSIAEGSGTVAKGRASHAEGAMTQALSDGSHTEGYQTKATGYWSHAEGEMTTVSSYASHAEGSYCTLPDGTKRYGTASGYASHVEGGGCHTTGSCAHAEGLGSTASGAQSHVEGRYTIAAGGAQHVEGIANIEDTADEFIHIAGNGTFNERSNAYTLDWEGNAWFSGDVYINSASGKNRDEGSKKLATEEYVDEQLNSASSSKLISHVLPIEATEENQTIFPINLETFDAANDTVLVQDGITLLLPNSGFAIENNTIVMTTPWGLGDTGSILILKNIPILADETTISGAIIENNSITLDKLNANVINSIKPIMTIITLPVSNWIDNKQTIAVQGILADETAQSIRVSPYSTVENIEACSGVYCIGQGENSLTFSCDEIPDVDIKFIIEFSEVVYI